MKWHLDDGELRTIARELGKLLGQAEGLVEYEARYAMPDTTFYCDQFWALSPDLAVTLAKDAVLIVPNPDGPTTQEAGVTRLRLVIEKAHGGIVWERRYLYPSPAQMRGEG